MKFFSLLTVSFLASIASANYRCKCTGTRNVDNISNNCCESRITLSDGTRVSGNVERGGMCAYYSTAWSTAEFSNSFARCCRATGDGPVISNGAQCNPF